MNMHRYRTLLLAASILAAAGAASAETLLATIPFNFQTGKSQMPAGKYTIQQLTPGSGIVLMSNWAAGKSVAVMGSARMEAKSSGPPRLIFQCSDNLCTLSEVWGALPGGQGMRVPAPQLSPRDRERLSVVYLDRKSGDH